MKELSDRAPSPRNGMVFCFVSFLFPIMASVENNDSASSDLMDEVDMPKKIEDIFGKKGQVPLSDNYSVATSRAEATARYYELEGGERAYATATINALWLMLFSDGE